MISLKIDVSKIDKKRLFKGEKGTYLDAIMIETPNSEYSDYMIVQGVSREERKNGVRGEILGNGKILTRTEPQSETDQLREEMDYESSDLPF